MSIICTSKMFIICQRCNCQIYGKMFTNITYINGSTNVCYQCKRYFMYTEGLYFSYTRCICCSYSLCTANISYERSCEFYYCERCISPVCKKCNDFTKSLIVKHEFNNCEKHLCKLCVLNNCTDYIEKSKQFEKDAFMNVVSNYSNVVSKYVKPFL